MSGTVFVQPHPVDEAAPGIVYVLTNAAMPGLVKIGRTTGDLVGRLRALDSTGVPLPFECVFAAKVQDCVFVERKLHLAFGDHRIRQSREFFRLAPERVKAVLELVQGIEVTPKVDVVQTPDDQVALDRERKRASVFRFSLVGIAPGATLVSTIDPNRTAIVIDDRRISLDGVETSLASATRIVGQENGYRSEVWQGSNYWSYGEKTLQELRQEAEFGEGGE